jgi:FkbM family methyltransferase
MNLSRWPRAWKRHVSIPVRSYLAPEVTARVRGRKIRVDIRDYPIGQNLYLDGEFEPELQNLLPHLNLSGAVCLDIGANIGLHTITMCGLAGPAGQVVAFEPEAHNFKLLEQNLQLNGVTNVRLEQCVVSDQEGRCKIGLSPDNYGDHRISTLSPSEWQTQEVRMTTVDASVGEFPDGAIRFIKIDVQGHEIPVLRGMKQTLQKNPDAIMVVEVQPDLLANAGTSAADLMQLMKDWDFTGWELLEHRIIPVSAPWVYDLIRNRSWVNVVLSRNRDLLRRVMSSYCEVELPAADS